MSTPLIMVTTVIYAIVSINEAIGHRVGMSTTFFGYALANLGLMWSMK